MCKFHTNTWCFTSSPRLGKLVLWWPSPGLQNQPGELNRCTGTMADSFCSRLSSVVCLDSGPQTLWRWSQAVPQVKALLGVDRACDQEWQDLCSWALHLPEQSFSSWQVRVCLWSQYPLWGTLGYEKLMKISFESFRMQGICGKFVSSLNHCSVPQSYTQCRE